MKFLKEYGVKEEELLNMKDTLNENIIKFFIQNESFIREKLDYLKNKELIIYPIIEGNIKIFLESQITLEKK